MIRFHQQKIYLFDVLNGLVRVFDSKGNAMHQWDISSSMSGLPGLYSDFKVLSDNTFALLDYNRSQYQLFVDGYLTQVWGNKGIIEESANYDSTFLGPLSMDIYNDQLLINDSGNFRVIQISLENERYLKPKMMVWPHEINVNVEFPYELSFHINVHRVDDDTPLFLIHPFGISCLPWEVNSKSSVLEWQLQKNFLETNSSIIDEITIRSDKVEITIPIRIERNPVSIDITPGEIQKGLQKIYPPIRSKFEGHLFMIELETIENIFGFECKVFNEDLIINLPNEILILKANESKGRLFDHQGMTYMDLGQKVIISKGHYLIPLNSILKHLNIRYDVKNKRATLAWTLPYEA